MAYLINRKGMERVLAQTWAQDKWVLKEERVLVSDELLYLHGITYTATRAFVGHTSKNFASLIQNDVKATKKMQCICKLEPVLKFCRHMCFGA